MMNFFRRLFGKPGVYPCACACCRQIVHNKGFYCLTCIRESCDTRGKIY